MTAEVGSPGASLFDRTLELETTGSGVYERDIDRTWWGWNGQFGGYVMALALEATRRHDPDPSLAARSLTLHFLRRLPEGRCRIEVHTERQGRTAATHSIRMFVDDRLCAVGLVLFGAHRDNEEFLAATPPDLTLPAPDRVPVAPPLPGHAMEQLEMWPSEELSFLAGVELAEVGGWIRLREGGRADERFLALACDAWPPAFLFRHTRAAVGGTLELTAHFRDDIPPSVLAGTEPVRLVLRLAASRAGYIDEDCEIWSADGRLLLQSRQLRYNELNDDAPVRPGGPGSDPAGGGGWG